MKKIFICCVTFLIGCNQQEIYNNRATDKCSNLDFRVARIFPGETVNLYYNNEIILRYMADSTNGYRVKRNFCLEYKNDGILKIVSVFNNKIYIDTSLSIKKMNFGYLLTVSLPHPYNWKDYYENNSPVPTKEWGYLPIENSTRLISINPDTIFRRTISNY